MIDYIGKFERVVTMVLRAMLAVVVALSIADLTWVLFKDMFTPHFALLDVDELLDVYGLFLLVLIGVELLETLKTYVRDREIRAEAIIAVAVTALARKIVTLDVKAVSGVSLLGVAALMVALGLTYYLIRGVHGRGPKAPASAVHTRRGSAPEGDLDSGDGRRP